MTADARQRGFAPVVRGDARVLILGSFPGGASLAAGKYYAHPRNQFWPIVGTLIGLPLEAMDYDTRLECVKEAGIAIWDVVQACVRQGSLDADIRDAQANDFASLLERAPAIRAVAFNGATAARHAEWFASQGLATYRMPSTSPAYAGMPAHEKLRQWQRLRDDGWLAR